MAVIGFLLALENLRIGVIGVDAVKRGGDAVEEAEVHLALVVPGGLNRPSAPEELPEALLL